MMTLDEQIARQVMGWRLVNLDTLPLCDANGEPVEGGPEWRTADGGYTGRYAWNWAPSEDIGAAWEVIQRLGELFPLEDFALRYQPYWKDHQPDPIYSGLTRQRFYAYEAGFERMTDADSGGRSILDVYCKVFAEADTAPVAICKAALKATSVP
jgi:hypothetical protein